MYFPSLGLTTLAIILTWQALAGVLLTAIQRHILMFGRHSPI